MSHVFNFDVPWQPDDYTHRIGRTGRAGATGIAITLATPDDAEAIAGIEKLMGIKIARSGATGATTDDADAAPSPDEKPVRARRSRKPAADTKPEASPERAPRRAAPPEAKPRRTPEPEPARDRPLVAAAEDADAGWNGPVPSFLEMSIPS